MDITDLRQPNSPTIFRAGDLVRLAQGFYGIFWGLLMVAVVGAQQLAVPSWRTLPDIFLMVGIVTVVGGSLRLWQAQGKGIVSPAMVLWRARCRTLLALAGLLLYFGVLFELWRRLPSNVYLLANAAVFVLVGIVYTIVFCRVVGALAIVWGERELAFQSWLYQLANAGLMLLPFMVILSWIVAQILRQHVIPFDEFSGLLHRANPVFLLVWALPFSLTLALAWTAKDAVLRRLSDRVL